MYRVVGRDVRGALREISVSAESEEGARAVVLASGDILIIERVTAASSAAPSGSPLFRQVAVAAFCCLSCLGIAALGTFLGAAIGHEMDERQHELIRTRWLVGAAAGGFVGFILGVCTIPAILRASSRS